jgi:NTE family protein
MAIDKALVLSGGSIKGAFQAGAIAHVLKCFEPDLVVGTSVGSLNGSFAVSRTGLGRSWEEAGTDLVHFWQRRITRFGDIGRKRSTTCVVLSLRKRFDGLLDMSRLYGIVRDEIRTADIVGSPADFYACSVDLDSGDACYAGKDETDLVEYVIASTAIPLVMPIKMVGGKPFWDGGVREVAPLKKAIQLGATEIVCIACDPKVTPRAEIGGPTAPFMQLADRLMTMVTNETLNNDIGMVEDVNEYLAECPNPSGLLDEREVIDLTVIRPDEDLKIDLVKFNSADIQRLIDSGTRIAERDYPCES